MSISAYASIAYSRVGTRMSQALEAFFPEDNKVRQTRKSDSKGSIAEDLVSLSPANQMRQTISRFKETTSYTEMNLSIEIKIQSSLESKEGIEEAVNSMDSMLRLISKDEDEYTAVKGQITDLLTERSKIMDAFNASEPSASSELEALDDDEAPTNKEQLKAQIVKMMLKMSKNGEGAETEFEPGSEEESQSISKAFFAAISSVFSSTTKVEAAVQTPPKINASAAQFRSQTESSSLRVEEVTAQVSDPLVLDLSGEGIKLTKAGEGAYFDITGDGKKENVAWVKDNTAFLTYDRNGNGVIDDGKEFFGDQNGAADGFKELAKYDDNKDGIIDNKDKIYAALKLYRDLDGNGKIDKGELSGLNEMGIKSLNLNCVAVDKNVNGNSLILNGSFEKADGSKGQLADVLLGFK
ncbi:MAG: hypothetical protein PHF29_04970 [Candidatus Riflebacteria bacterium]|nr:hypothetical protein [Candidatus Riflebacteria bacterium]